MNYQPGDILRVHSRRSGVASELVRLERLPRDGSPLLPVRFQRVPTQAERQRGDYDRWVKSVTRINPERVIAIESHDAKAPSAQAANG